MDGQPLAFASRTLTSTERGHAQIEKDCSAVVFACERFNKYLFGRESVSVQSDHKPLETIFAKPLTAAPKRLKVGYVKGREMFLADTLSRAPLPSTAPLSIVPDQNMKKSVVLTWKVSTRLNS